MMNLAQQLHEAVGAKRLDEVNWLIASAVSSFHGAEIDDLYKEFRVIRLRGEANLPFYKLLIRRWTPLLSMEHLGSTSQWVIEVDGKVVGVISIYKGEFLQIALVPWEVGTGIGRRAIEILVRDIYPMDRIRWTTNRRNIASLKLLRSLGGGVFEAGVSNPLFKELEGQVRYDKPLPGAMLDALDLAIREAEKNQIKPSASPVDLARIDARLRKLVQ